ncbi:NAD(P)H-dependent flavin oxidoreductase [Heyndrickxia sporothermodurans]|uniref:NAD(P)H-dependent flavin oxidoreductase n=1 Tax=Heyndrickxia sporothermodurans TaxID=46224 RepID=UPI0035DB1A79
MNHLTQLLGIELPIIQGGMGNISNAKLSAAVSNAGGLGTMGVGTMTPEKVEKMILEIVELTNKPFAINLPINVNPHIKEMVSLIIKHKVPIVSLSAGNPAPLIPIFHDHDIKVMVVTGSVKHAKKAEMAGADIIVAEGFEAAGINSPFESTTMTLIPQIVDAVKIPVVAAGGIANGRGLLAAMALGAQGVQMGTRFVATKDAPFSQDYKKRILNANDHQTIIIGRSKGQVRRVLDGEYSSALLKNEENYSLPEYIDATSEKHHLIGAIEGNEKDGFMNSGQIAGMIHDEPTVCQLFEQMMSDCRKTLKNIESRLNI